MKRTLAFLVRCLPLVGLSAVALLGAVPGCAGDLDPSLIPNNTGVAGTSGGGGTMGGAGTGGTVTACDAPGMLFAADKPCGACHSAGNALGAGFDLASAGVVGRLVGKTPSTDATAMCQASGKTYLVAGSSPASGLLIEKVTQKTPSCGSAMPIGLPLTAPQKMCLTDWATAVTTGAITQ
jgi:hypothetical protein